MSDYAPYTPTTDEVRRAWTFAATGHESDRTDQEARDLFDLWLAAHDATVRAEAQRKLDAVDGDGE